MSKPMTDKHTQGKTFIERIVDRLPHGGHAIEEQEFIDILTEEFGKFQPERSAIVKKQKNVIEISAVFYSATSEVELTWDSQLTGKSACLITKVNDDIGRAISEVVPPCVYHDATVVDPEKTAMVEAITLAQGIPNLCFALLECAFNKNLAGHQETRENNLNEVMHKLESVLGRVKT